MCVVLLERFRQNSAATIPSGLSELPRAARLSQCAKLRALAKASFLEYWRMAVCACGLLRLRFLRATAEFLSCFAAFSFFAYKNR
ncbi:MAG: hypothetical protein DBX55_05450 [Verrucomicrobia bacterium]|nr:MAG: hypothetical protein DBX55_05450 [Verrucomicrobiota bacterium]